MACGVRAGTSGLCGRCRPGYSRAWAVGSYSSVLGELVRTMKFDGAREATRTIASLLDARLPALPTSVRLVPLPTIRPHIRERGFDHTLVMARQLGRLRGLPVDRSLVRRAQTVQRGKTLRERQRQATRAFGVAGPLDLEAIYLLLDDVVTTGSSMRAAARCLREAGASEVWAASLTREPLDEGA